MITFMTIIPEEGFNLHEATIDQLKAHYQAVLSEAQKRLDAANAAMANASENENEKIKDARNLLAALNDAKDRNLNEQQLRMLISTASYAVKVLVFGTDEDNFGPRKEVQEDVYEEVRCNATDEGAFIRSEDENKRKPKYYKKVISLQLTSIEFSPQTEAEYQANAKQLGLCAIGLKNLNISQAENPGQDQAENPGQDQTENSDQDPVENLDQDQTEKLNHSENKWLKDVAFYALRLSVVSLVVSGVVLSVGFGAIPAAAIAAVLGVSTTSVSAIAPSLIIGGFSGLAAGCVSAGVGCYARFYASGKDADDLTARLAQAETENTLKNS